MKGTNHLKSFSGQCFVDHHAGGLMEGICSLHGKFPQIQFSFCVANFPVAIIAVVLICMLMSCLLMAPENLLVAT